MLKFWFCVNDLKRDDPFCSRDNPFCNRDNPFCNRAPDMCVSDAVRWCSKCSLCNETLSKVDLEILYSIYSHSIYVIFFTGVVIDTR